jgi:endo-1,4-beta-xylanase
VFTNLTALAMVSFKSLIVAVSAAVCALAAPSANLTARAGTPSSEGTHNGFFYSWWTDNGAQATYTNGPGGNYAYVMSYA